LVDVSFQFNLFGSSVLSNSSTAYTSFSFALSDNARHEHRLRLTMRPGSGQLPLAASVSLVVGRGDVDDGTEDRGQCKVIQLRRRLYQLTSLLRFDVQLVVMLSQSERMSKRCTAARFNTYIRFFTSVRSNMSRQSTTLRKGFSTAWLSTNKRFFSRVHSKVR
jgi:hypothetical protein